MVYSKIQNQVGGNNLSDQTWLLTQIISLLYVVIILVVVMDPRKLSFSGIFLIGEMCLISGPSSIDPKTNKAYGTSFPMLSVEDTVRAQFLLLEYLGIEKVCNESNLHMLF